jgi:acyl-CoA dehydrogenase
VDFELTESQTMMVGVLRDLLTSRFDPAYFRKLEDTGTWPTDVLRVLGEHGFIGVVVPEEYGGSGGTTIDSTLCLEEAARVMGGPAMAYFTTMCFGARSLAEFGTPEQRAKILPGVLAGTSFIGLSLTEPDGGTDVLGAMKTRADADGDGGYVIRGAKVFTTGAHIADWLLVVARTEGFEEKRSYGLTLFLVPTTAEGLTIRPIPLFNNNATGANHVILDEVRVGADQILGQPHLGLKSLFGVLNDERIGAAIMSVGLSQAALDEALAYAKVREAFGRPIGAFQAVQHKLAECWTRIEAARYLTYHAAWMQTKGLPAEKESSAAKLFASETSTWVINECMDILGGYSCTLEFNMSYLFRDARYTFAPITNNAAKNLIGERLGLPKSY